MTGEQLVFEAVEIFDSNLDCAFRYDGRTAPLGGSFRTGRPVMMEPQK